MNPKSPVVSVVIVAATAAAMALLWRDNLVTSLALIVIVAVSFMIWRERKDVIRLVLAAIIGSLAEMLAIYSGAWSYANPDFLIPVWLPLAWGIAGLNLVRISEWFTERFLGRAA